MAKTGKTTRGKLVRSLVSPSSIAVEGRAEPRRGRKQSDDNRSGRFDSSAAGRVLTWGTVVSTKHKLKVGLEIVLNESTDEVLARRSDRGKWSTNGLKPRGSLKLKLTKEQRKALQTPAYMR
jgi:hypothetical protein